MAWPSVPERPRCRSSGASSRRRPPGQRQRSTRPPRLGAAAECSTSFPRAARAPCRGSGATRGAGPRAHGARPHTTAHPDAVGGNRRLTPDSPERRPHAHVVDGVTVRIGEVEHDRGDGHTDASEGPGAPGAACRRSQPGTRPRSAPGRPLRCSGRSGAGSAGSSTRRASAALPASGRASRERGAGASRAFSAPLRLASTRFAASPRSKRRASARMRPARQNDHRALD